MRQDGNGTLDRGEVQTLVELIGAKISEEELDAAMAKLDADSSGSVDFSEFKTYWEEHATSGGCEALLALSCSSVVLAIVRFEGLALSSYRCAATENPVCIGDCLRESLSGILKKRKWERRN